MFAIETCTNRLDIALKMNELAFFNYGLRGAMIYYERETLRSGWRSDSSRWKLKILFTFVGFFVVGQKFHDRPISFARDRISRPPQRRQQQPRRPARDLLRRPRLTRVSISSTNEMNFRFVISDLFLFLVRSCIAGFYNFGLCRSDDRVPARLCDHFAHGRPRRQLVERQRHHVLLQVAAHNYYEISILIQLEISYLTSTKKM